MARRDDRRPSNRRDRSARSGPRQQRSGQRQQGTAAAQRSVARNRGRRRRGGGSDLGRRILFAVPAIIFALTIISVGGPLFALGVLALGVLCIGELLGLYAPLRPVRAAGILAVIGLCAGAYFGGERYVLIAVVAIIALVFALSLVRQDRPEIPQIDGIAITVMGSLWIGFGVAYAVLLRELPNGGGLVFAILLGTFIGDTAAYIGGRSLGRRRLAPRVSPNKTIEGLACGFFACALVIWWYGLGSEWMGGTKGILLGLAVGALAPLGDLFESQVKRDAGVKDAGTLFGPHGGALDRIDAALFTLVGGYYIWMLLV